MSTVVLPAGVSAAQWHETVDLNKWAKGGTGISSKPREWLELPRSRELVLVARYVPLDYNLQFLMGLGWSPDIDRFRQQDGAGIHCTLPFRRGKSEYQYCKKLFIRKADRERGVLINMYVYRSPPELRGTGTGILTCPLTEEEKRAGFCFPVIRFTSNLGSALRPFAEGLLFNFAPCSHDWHDVDVLREGLTDSVGEDAGMFRLEDVGMFKAALNFWQPSRSSHVARLGGMMGGARIAVGGGLGGAKGAKACASSFKRGFEQFGIDIEQEFTKSHICANCSRAEDENEFFMACSRCKGVRYCSKLVSTHFT